MNSDERWRLVRAIRDFSDVLCETFSAFETPEPPESALGTDGTLWKDSELLDWLGVVCKSASSMVRKSKTQIKAEQPGITPGSP